VRSRKPTVWEFGLVSAFALVCAAFALNTPDDSQRAHIEVSGTLNEHQIIGRRRARALRFRLNTEQPEFRVGPGLFADAMHNAVPVQFRSGARVTIVVVTDQYSHPIRPLLNDRLRIVWVHGLSVNGQRIFGLEDLRTLEGKNRSSFYVLCAASLGAAAYLGIRLFPYRRRALR
jgi:hypothetical protein